MALAAAFSLLGFLPLGLLLLAIAFESPGEEDILLARLLSVGFGLVLPAVIILVTWITLALNNNREEARVTKVDEESSAMESSFSFTRDGYQKLEKMEYC